MVNIIWYFRNVKIQLILDIMFEITVCVVTCYSPANDYQNDLNCELFLACFEEIAIELPSSLFTLLVSAVISILKDYCYKKKKMKKKYCTD